MSNNLVSISEFKSHCLEFIAQLQINHQPIIITKHKKMVAKIEALSEEKNHSLFGSMKNRAVIKKDMVKSIDEKWSCENEQ